MRLSKSFFTTIKEDVKSQDCKSGNLLVRSGMITKVGSGIYTFLPLGLKTLNKINNIIREEMNKAGAEELFMPALIPTEYYEASGRLNGFGSDMFRLTDRFNRDYALGPTHEELFASVAKLKIKSYKDMPFTLYQIQNKYRDEMRPRYGLIRVREFFMKDAYSFDKDEAGLSLSYNKMYEAYKRIFDRIGVDYKIVKADTGTMGGSLSEEFQAITDIGEDVIVYCDNCDYASNLEVADVYEDGLINEEELEAKLVETPNKKSIKDVSEFLNVPVTKLVKTLIYKVDDKLYAVLIRGDRELNECKLEKALNAKHVELASGDEVKNNTEASIGFVGPINMNLPIIIDSEVENMKNFVVGANIIDYHYVNVNLKDFKYELSTDLKQASNGDLCPVCGSKLLFKKGIEIGNTFKLGTKYSESLDLKYTDEDNNLKPVVMGSYGIGCARIMAAVAEQNVSEDGTVSWPINIAPYEVVIIPVSMKDEEQVKFSSELYTKLNDNYDVALDDRDERAGVKFNDADLIGAPIKVIVGKKLNEGTVEVKYLDKTSNVDINDVYDYVTDIIKENK
ncbi:MAG: proline--tRNA ligase [Bacilli bacterium]|nr:proline--tRNA ligase [Bacilli bacterium]